MHTYEDNSTEFMQAPTLTWEETKALESRLHEVAELETLMQERPLIDSDSARDTGRKVSKWLYWDNLDAPEGF